jgi:pSer/pThr/pTyr-binding forkhead associated (FHA) protein
MVYFLEVLDGPRQGSRFQLSAGQVIGRTSGDIRIEDEKISSRHAQVDLDNKQQFVLTDLGSSNGIISSNRRVNKIAMMPGVKFRLGRTSFLVIAVEGKPAPEFAKIRTWKENLAEKMPVETVKNDLANEAGKTFSPCLSLNFIQGIQTDESIFIAYGPRRFGAHCLDIDLKDPDAPDLAFELIPGAGIAKIKNHCKNKLTLNNKSVTTDILKDGDMIRIGATIIKVVYV